MFILNKKISLFFKKTIKNDILIMVVGMVFNFITNKYLLIWYFLCDKSSNGIKHNFLISNRKEYFLLIKEKDTIKQYLNNYIPDDDTIFYIFSNTDEYSKLKKITNKYRVLMLTYYDQIKKEVEKELLKLLKYNLKLSYNLCFIYPKLNIIEFDFNNNLIILGKEMNENEAISFYVLTLYKILENEYKNFRVDDKNIVLAVLELVIYNELYTRITKKNKYGIGSKNIKSIKEKIYPYFLMYIGLSEEEILKRQMEDNIYFSHVKYDKNLKLMDLYSFITYLTKNKNKILNCDIDQFTFEETL